MTAEVGRFLIVGLLTVGLDYSIYSTLLWLAVPVAPAKAAGFIGGAVFAFFANREITFLAKGRSYAPLRFGLVYLISLAANVGMNKLALTLLPDAIKIAFLVATGVSATLNFVGMKLFVFSVPRSGAAR